MYSKYLYVCLFFLSLCCFLFPLIGLCQEAEDAVPETTIGEGLAVFDLGKIEVVGNADAIETNSVTVVTSETVDSQLKESVLDVTRRLPGISVTVGNKNEPQIMMRGFDQKYISILYDGVPMASPYYSDIDTSELPLDNIAEIKVVRGNASVLYGPNALGGVISLNSAKPGPKPSFSLLGTIDQEGNSTGRFNHGQNLGSFYYLLSAGFRNSDGWAMSDDFKPTRDSKGNLLEDGDIRENSDYSQWSVGAKAGKEWDSGELSLSFNYQDADKGIPPTTNPDDRARFWDFTEWKKYSVGLAAQTELGESGDLRGNFFYHKYDNVLEAYTNSSYSERMWTSSYDDWSAGAALRTGWTLNPDMTLRAAFNSVLDNHKAQDDLGEPWQEYSAMTSSIAAELEWKAVKMLHLQIGAAYDLYNFDDTKNVEGSSAAISNRADDVNSGSFNILATLPIDEMNSFTAGVSRKNRFPNMHELFSNIELFDPEDVDTLESEVAMQYSLGYTMQHKLFTMGVSGFYYDVEDKILRADRDSLYDNIDKATYKGVEFWSSFGDKTGVFGGLSYTWQETENKSPGMPEQPLPLVPKNHLHIDLGYGFDFGTSVNAGYTYRGEVIQYDSSGLNPTDVPSYSLVDLTIRHSFDFGLSIVLQGLNLLDENYYQEKGYEQPGRTLKLGLQFTI